MIGERTFRFRGQTLLKLRRQHLQEASQEFVLAQAGVEAIEARMATLRQTLHDYDDAARQAVWDNDAARLGLYRQFAGQVEQALAQEQRLLEEARQRMEVRRSALELAMKESKAVGTLRDRLAARHEQAMEQQAVREADQQHAAYWAQRPGREVQA